MMIEGIDKTMQLNKSVAAITNTSVFTLCLPFDLCLSVLFFEGAKI